MSDPRQHIMPVYRPPEQVFEKGEGVYLFTEDGTRYLDFIAGIAVNALGHAHPAMVEALQDQAGKLWHTSNMFRVRGAEELSDKICRDTFADRVFFTNSGTEAVECAIKSARKYHWANGNEERVDIITFTGAFHGRSLGAINAGGNPKYLEGFGPKLPGFVHLEWGDHDALKAAAAQPTTAAVFVEPVQGEGGVRAMPDACLKGLRELCDEHGILLIYDEVQCGMGRTGKLFAYEWSGIEPDILSSAKGLGGGFPIGACLANDKASACMVVGTHGSTFGGNPLATAVGNAVLDLMLEDGFLDQVRERGQQLKNGLADVAARHPQILGDVQGLGLMLGVKCHVPNTDMLARLRDARLLTGRAGSDILRLLPPLNLTEHHISEALNIIDQVCKDWT